jgi:hypothetical protein
MAKPVPRLRGPHGTPCGIPWNPLGMVEDGAPSEPFGHRLPGLANPSGISRPWTIPPLRRKMTNWMTNRDGHG